jgi:alpha-amylase/alpha-mannosidase (GH57 family)
MSVPPLKVAFLWHMHQPCYKDPRTGVYRLPWVRLHAVKDYYDMVARLEAFPRLKANFNLVPSLVEQIRDYASGEVNEVQLELAAKTADDLTNQEKLALVKDSFLGNRKKMIEPYPRYRSLLDKCPNLESEYKAQAAMKKCGRQDFLDLQVWSNLAWIDPLLHDDPLIAALLVKGRQFTEAMKTSLLDKQMEIVRRILPKYKELADKGRIELAFSPYFHPILPLLCDSEIARVAMPGVSLPKHRLRFPEDARMQMALGLDLHHQVFGRQPAGMWPPEGSVSDEALAIAAELGVKWTAADEGVLEASCGVVVRDAATGQVTRPDLLYKPHRLTFDGGEVQVFFRDKMLSDLISFHYMKSPAEEAVADLLGRLEAIRRDLGAEARSSVVLIALDGENCWEFYDKDGDAFLRQLYSELSRADWIETVRLSEVLEDGEATPCLKSIYPGSWIGSNFAIWIGSAEDNTAWDMICDARAELVAKENTMTEAAQRSAWRSVYAAEGSDWFWWYGGEHVSSHNPEYDALFRSHIRRVYDATGGRTPSEVLYPITLKQKGPAFAFEPVALMKPVLDGRVTTFYEWRLAGLYESYRDVSRHTPVAPVVSAIHFGFDHENLYVRIDTSVSPQSAQFAAMAFRLEFRAPTEREFTLKACQACAPGGTDLAVTGGPDEPPRAVALEIIEMAVPFALIGARPGAEVAFRLAVLRGDQVVERRPFHEVISLMAPTADFEAEMWSTL